MFRPRLGSVFCGLGKLWSVVSREPDYWTNQFAIGGLRATVIGRPSSWLDGHLRHV